MKDCIEIWQKATIRDALPDEYKEKTRQEQAKMFIPDMRLDLNKPQNLLLLTKTVIFRPIQRGRNLTPLAQ
jgi:hypothetical protein